MSGRARAESSRPSSLIPDDPPPAANDAWCTNSNERFYWLGLSIGMHAFPSTDLSRLWASAPALAKKGKVLAIISLPLAGLLVVLNYARVIWADLGYGIAVGILGPLALFRALAC